MQSSNPITIPLANQPPLQSSSVHQAPNSTNDYRLHAAGYPRLAVFLSKCPRYLHLRRFSALAIRLLLYRQNFLIELENKLHELEVRDANSTEPGRQRFCSDFARLRASPPTQHGSEQNELYETLKNEVKEYGKLAREQ